MAYHSKEAITVIIAILCIGMIAGCTALTVITFSFNVEVKDVDVVPVKKEEPPPPKKHKKPPILRKSG